MFELPLFPLNTVLFPGMPLSLHIFEERYKLMIGLCLKERRPFGAVLIKEGVEASGPLADPHAVGCLAHIIQVQRLREGRLNITTVGRERFRILALDRARPYLVGQVEHFPLGSEEPAALQAAARRLQPWLERYLEELARLAEEQVEAPELPADPVELAYLAAAVLQLPNTQKQRLLATEQAADLLNDMRGLYRREVALVRSLAGHEAQDQGSFSLN